MKNVLLPMAAAAGLIAVLVVPAQAANLVQNGSFETNGGVGEVGGSNPVSTLSNWTVGSTTDSATYPFTFVLNGSADSSGFNSPFGTIRIWGPNTPTGTSSGPGSNPDPHSVGPVANGFSGGPDGSYFFGADAAYANAPISQTISGLTPGDNYSLSFSYAGAQFTDALGPNTEGWHVTFGGDSVDTSTLNNASKGFTGWNNFSTNFTASSASQTLTFLATGGPSGLPPFALLDNVSLTDTTTPPPPPPSDTPEPSSMGLAVSGLLGALGFARRMKSRS